MRTRSWMVGIVLAGLVVSVASAAGLEKKLINFGWDMCNPRQLEEKIGELQRLPFDGLTVRVKELERIWGTGARGISDVPGKDVDAALVEANVEAMSRVKWGKFTDNFMYMKPGYGVAAVDWFDEAAWGDDGYVIERVRAYARIGHAGKCKGMLFDPEAGDVVWEFQKQPRRDEKGIAAMRAMVRKRGAQFIDAIEAEMPNPVFLTLFWSFNKVTGLREVAYAQDPERINEIIGGVRYGLLHDFMLGIVEGADRGTMVVDGNEVSYYADDFEDYNADYHYIRHTMLGAVPEELRYKHRAQVYVGHAIYADLYHNTRGIAYPYTFMTPEERAVAMEWVVYHALKNSDKYVWFYTEKIHYLRNVRVPPEMIPAIERARQKVARNEKIGFDYNPLRERAGKALRQAVWGAFEPSKAQIVRAISTPKIDGKLDDDLWKNASQLGPFQNFRTATQELHTKTTAFMTYDDTNLYIAFRCEDPAMDKLSDGGYDIRAEGEVYVSGRNCVEVEIAADADASKFYDIKVNFKNHRWDSLSVAYVWPNEIDGKNSSWDGEYETATHVDKTFWSLEIAIPWATLNRQVPKAGEQIKGNLIFRGGQRGPLEFFELSSWSQRVRYRGVEAKHFGTWEFK